MKDMGTVSGSKAQAVPLVVGYDTVYVHTDIQAIEVDNGDGTTYTTWQYHEVQYGKDEYLKKVSVEKDLLEVQTTDLQLALADVFESGLTQAESANQQITELQLALVELYETTIQGG